MKKLLLIAVLFLAACAPQLARPLMVYAATTEQITNAIVSVANRTAPDGGYSNWTVTGISETSVALRSDLNLLGKLGNNRSTLTMTWTFIRRDGGVVVAVNSGGFDDPRKTEQLFFDALDRQFGHL